MVLGRESRFEFDEDCEPELHLTMFGSGEPIKGVGGVNDVVVRLCRLRLRVDAFPWS
jgi:hypothetical protein